MLKPWEKLEHKAYYSKDDDRLYTAYELYIMFEDHSDDEALQDYHGDFLDWINQAEFWDDLRPVEACTVLLVNLEDGRPVMLLIEAYETEEDARGLES